MSLRPASKLLCFLATRQIVLIVLPYLIPDKSRCQSHRRYKIDSALKRVCEPNVTTHSLSSQVCVEEILGRNDLFIVINDPLLKLEGHNA